MLWGQARQEEGSGSSSGMAAQSGSGPRSPPSDVLVTSQRPRAGPPSLVTGHSPRPATLVHTPATRRPNGGLQTRLLAKTDPSFSVTELTIEAPHHSRCHWSLLRLAGGGAGLGCDHCGPARLSSWPGLASCFWPVLGLGQDGLGRVRQSRSGVGSN